MNEARKSVGVNYIRQTEILPTHAIRMAMADDDRLRILFFLQRYQILRPSDLCELVGISKHQISVKLRQLSEAGIIEKKPSQVPDNRVIYYGITLLFQTYVAVVLAWEMQLGNTEFQILEAKYTNKKAYQHC